MNVQNINRNTLAGDTYYYCAKCRSWFDRGQFLPRNLCPDCGTLCSRAVDTPPKNATLILRGRPIPRIRTDSPGQTIFLFCLFLLVLAGGWAFVTVPATFQAAWFGLWSDGFHFRAALNHWTGFLGGLLLTWMVLALTTVLLFGLLRVLLYGLLMLLAGATLFAGSGDLRDAPEWTEAILAGDSHVIDTLLNLIASLGALLVFSWLFGRPPGIGDFGSQAVVALGITIFALMSRQARSLA